VSAFTNREKADAAAREVRMRQRVYPRRVASGAMDQTGADKQIAIMEEIAQDYRAMAEQDDASGRLL
jgi:hypothetical protein